MSRWDDLKEQVQNESRQLWEKIEESSIYNQLKDRYENLTPQKQKIVVILAATAAVVTVLSFPYSYYSTSSDTISEFKDRRDLLREMQKVARESAEVPDLPVPPTVEIVKSMISSQLMAAQLLPEQIRSTEIEAVSSKLISPQLMQNAVVVSLAKLNLQQIVDIGYQLQNISASIKLKDLSVVATTEAGYFDVVYKLITLAVPEKPTPAIAAPPEGKSPNRFRRGRDSNPPPAGGADE
ncbi:MAG: hypothetical protein ACOYOK_02650 [Pseudobdellovibrionaceae bacterium]|jgi:hypothetical protein